MNRIPQIPWFERKFTFDCEVGYFPVIIERLRGTSARIEDMVENEPDARLIHKMGDGWSVKEHIGHLYDLEELWYGRIEDYLSKKNVLRAADLRNTKTHEANHNSRKIVDLLQQFSEARNELIKRVSDIDEQTALLTALHPRLQAPMRLIDSLFFVAEHDDHHLAKMRELLV